MFVVMQACCSDTAVEHVIEFLEDQGLTAHPSRGAFRTVINVLGSIDPSDGSRHTSGSDLALETILEGLNGVESVIPTSHSYKLASRTSHPEDTVVEVPARSIKGGTLRIGSRQEMVMMAGPCTVENEKQLMTTAEAVRSEGVIVLRGGAFKPSTSPYGFRGLGKAGLKLLAKASKEFGMAVITEVMTPTDVQIVCEYADILQIGTRNMQNYMLLDEVGRVNTPVVLKRGMSATLEEWLLAAEYILFQGNRNVILCERGIRTFEKSTRNTMDISAIPLMKRLSHLPIISDPSQGTGRRDLVTPLALASIAAGTDALLIEVHPTPDLALKDGEQSLTIQQFRQLMPQAQLVAKAVGRVVAPEQTTLTASATPCHNGFTYAWNME